MVRSLIVGLFATGFCVSGGAAVAGEFQDQSSATIQITVDIPPYAAGLAARAEGAVGLWTMTDSRSALMVRLPDTVAGDGPDVQAAIFTSASSPIEVSASDPAISVRQERSNVNNGLVRHAFALSVSRPTSAEWRIADSAALVIAGV